MAATNDDDDDSGLTSEHQRLWVYGVNDCRTEDIAQKVKSFRASGSFRNDFKSLCKHCSLVAHPSLVPARGAITSGDATEDRDVEGAPGDTSTLSLQSQLFDLAAFQIMRHIIPTSLHLSVIRFTGCHLDLEMLCLLRAGFQDNCTVHTLHIDWNPVELPCDASCLEEFLASDSDKDLDRYERLREERQTERTLRGFWDVLLLRATQLIASSGVAAEDGPTRGPRELLETVWRHVCRAAMPFDPNTAMYEPLDVTAWTRAFMEGVHLPPRELEPIFQLLDDGPFGVCDGFVPLARLQLALERFEPQDEPGSQIRDGAETVDPIGSAFSPFLDSASTLEIVSFRCCNIGRLEMKPMCDSMTVGCRHLRALNLWGNRVCDACCFLLAPSLRGHSPYSSLTYLGLGRNLVTHAGLESLCSSIGPRRVEEKKEAERLQKDINLAAKERDKLAKKPDPPKVDGAGRERYKADFHPDSCEEMRDPNTGQVYWLHSRNIALRTLNLEENPVIDGSVVLRLQPFGTGDLILRKTPCVADVLAALAVPATTVEGGGEESSAGAAVPPHVAGWKLVL